jgi:hypothetical protein
MQHWVWNNSCDYVQRDVIDAKALDKVVDVSYVQGARRTLNNQCLLVICHIWPTFARAAMAFHMMGVSLGPLRIFLMVTSGASLVSITHS